MDSKINLKIGVLYSGGKDSNFIIYDKLTKGYNVQLLITIIPDSEDSMLFHYPNTYYTKMQAECIGIDIIQRSIYTNKLEGEIMELKDILKEARDNYGVTHILSGSLSSKFQYTKFKSICEDLDLVYETPLWGINEVEYMRLLINLGFKILISSVSAHGLDKSLLGKVIDNGLLDRLIRLSKVHGFNISFEGGEAETFVLDAPHFKSRLVVKDWDTYWDGIRGSFVIRRLEIERKVC